MRIAIIGTRGYPYVYSGFETFVTQLSVRLLARGNTVTVYCHRGLFRERPRLVNGVSLVYVPAIESKSLSQFSHTFLSVLHAVFCRYDILLFVNSANGPFGIITRLFRKRTVINVDGLEWLRPKWKGLGAKYFRWASRIATKVFDVVVTDSLRMAEIYRKEFGSPSITIAYGAEIAQSSRPELVHGMGLVPGGYYLIVGRLIPDNNGDLIVRGFVKSAVTRKLVIVGDVPYSDRYAREVRAVEDPRLVFPGYVRDQNLLRELYCNAYVYLHGHEFGGTNPSLLHALACGCCVAALDTVFSREVMQDDEYGLYFRKDARDVQRVLQELDANELLVRTYAEKARKRIEQAYDWDRITSQYESVFGSLVPHA